MNEVIRQLHERKSVRVFEDRAIEPEVKQAVLEAAVQAPSAGNMALYTILDITDPEMKQKLSVSCDNQPFIATAPMVLVFCADYRRSPSPSDIRMYNSICGPAGRTGEPLRRSPI